MLDNSILKNINCCEHTGFEVVERSAFGLEVFRDNFGNYRVLSPDHSGGVLLEYFKSGCFLVKAIFVKPEARRKGVARQLLAAITIHLNCDLSHGGMLTEDGKKLFKTC